MSKEASTGSSELFGGNMKVRELVQEAFIKRFGQSPELLVRAPGRVNLIGEHTDYNDGFVLPIAIDRAVWIALRPRGDRRVLISSLEMETPGDFSLDDLQKGGRDWYEYLKGVAWALSGAGYDLQGWEGVMSSDVPVGAGLSSSAAIEMATARAFAQVAGFDWDPVRMAQAGRKAENIWMGVSSGIGGNIGYPNGFLPVPNFLTFFFSQGLPAIATGAVLGILINLVFVLFKPPTERAAVEKK